MNTQVTREDWLLRAVDMLRPIFERAGFFVPPVKVSIGFTSGGTRSRHLGQCWASKCSADGTNQIFISPSESDPVEILDTLTHELVHAVDDCKSGHGEGFKKIALAIGLKGPMRSAGANEYLRQDLVRISLVLGQFPHGKLFTPGPSPAASIKRPGAKCGKCGFEIVMLKKHLHMGPPYCPTHMELMIETGEWDDI